MLDVISIGNATEDVFIKIHSRVFRQGVCFLPGAKVEVEEINCFTGGGATNTAVAFSRLGLKTGIVASIGGDISGSNILNELKRERVNTSLMVVSKKFCTAYSAILTGFGRDRIILTYRGATAQLNNERHIKWNKLKSKWFYISSFHTKPKVLKKLIDFGNRNGIKIALNPGSVELKSGLKKLSPLLKKADVVFLNKREAMQLTGRTNIERNLQLLHNYCPVVVITDGKNGVYAFDGSYIYFKKTFKVRLADATGCGDAFNSGFTAALIKGKDIEQSINWGMAESQSVIQYLGTKNVLLSEGGIKNFLGKWDKERKMKKKKV